MFQLKDVVVKDVLEVDDLTLNADVISIEGQSGTGKSTLLRLLNNLDDPTSGLIYFNEKKLTNITPLKLRKKIVMLPQNPVIFDGTIKHNLNLGLQLSDQELVSDEELKDMLDLFWLDKGLDTSANDLSGGEKQRLSLARILLMKETEVFLLDEPSSDLDDKTTNHIIESFIKHAKKNKQTIIMVTHDKSISKTFADDIINMDQYSKNVHSKEDQDGE